MTRIINNLESSISGKMLTATVDAGMVYRAASYMEFHLT